MFINEKREKGNFVGLLHPTLNSTGNGTLSDELDVTIIPATDSEITPINSEGNSEADQEHDDSFYDTVPKPEDSATRYPQHQRKPKEYPDMVLYQASATYMDLYPALKENNGSRPWMRNLVHFRGTKHGR